MISAIASQITGVSIINSTACYGADKRKHQSSASLASVSEIHRWPVNSSHKGSITRKMFPFDNVIMTITHWPWTHTMKHLEQWLNVLVHNLSRVHLTYSQFSQLIRRNIFGRMYSTDPFKFRWTTGHIRVQHSILSRSPVNWKYQSFPLLSYIFEVVCLRLWCNHVLSVASCLSRESCIQIGFKSFLAHITLIFDGWPQQIIVHLFYAMSSFVHHFISIDKFKLESQSKNIQFGSKLAFFSPVWLWNLVDDIKQQ